MGTHWPSMDGIGWMPRTVETGLQILPAAKRKREISFTGRKSTGKDQASPFAAPIPSTLAWENTARSQPCMWVSLKYQDTELQSSGETEL